MIEIEVPWPPTGNHAYTVAHGRKILSSSGRKYRDSVSAELWLRCRGTSLPGRLCVEITAHPPDRRVRDLDNLLKLPIDCVKRSNVIADDGNIDRLVIERGPLLKPGKLVIRIRQFNQAARAAGEG